MTTISVVIPTINEADRLPALVRQIHDQRFDEIIIADASVDDTTRNTVATLGVVCLTGLPCGRGRQMQAGAKAATCDILFFLHADSVLPTGARMAILSAMTDPRAIGGSFCLAFDRRDRLLRFYAWCSRLNFAVTTYGDQGLFMSRTTFDRIGGFKPLALLEDLEIQARLRPLGQFVKLAKPIVTSARRFVRRGIVRQQALNVAIVLAYLCGVTPERLARWYHGRSPSP